MADALLESLAKQGGVLVGIIAAKFLLLDPLRTSMERSSAEMTRQLEGLRRSIDRLKGRLSPGSRPTRGETWR